MRKLTLRTSLLVAAMSTGLIASSAIAQSTGTSTPSPARSSIGVGTPAPPAPSSAASTSVGTTPPPSPSGATSPLSAPSPLGATSPSGNPSPLGTSSDVMTSPNGLGISNPSTVGTTPNKSELTSSAFDMLDTGKRGFVTREDVAKLPGFDTAFQQADENNDGRLSQDEFDRAWMTYSRQP